VYLADQLGLETHKDMAQEAWEEWSSLNVEQQFGMGAPDYSGTNDEMYAVRAIEDLYRRGTGKESISPSELCPTFTYLGVLKNPGGAKKVADALRRAV